MVFIFSKEMVSWYLISRNLKEAVETMVIKPYDSNRSINLLPKRPIPDSDWIVSINQKVLPRNDQTRKWQNHSIYRIPNYLKGYDSKSYIPQSLSIGPYHHGVKELQPMECHKWRAVSNMLDRTGHDIRLYFDAMRRLEDSARSCYQNEVSLPSNKFVEMMTFDGIFILELLLIQAEKICYDANDPFCFMLDDLGRDILLLENQIPLFILNTLLGVQLNNRNIREEVVDLMSKFLDNLIPMDIKSPEIYRYDGLHILDIFCRNLQTLPIIIPKNESNGKSSVGVNPEQQQQQLEPAQLVIALMPRLRKLISRVNELIQCLKKLIPRLKELILCVINRIPLINELIQCVKKLFLCLKEEEEDTVVTQIPSAKELKQAGLKFQKKNSERFWDISFDGDTLSMPRLYLDYNTQSLLLNLVAYEQCHPDPDTMFRITAYLMFMDRLIESPEDVAILNRRDIINYSLASDEEVAKIFNDNCSPAMFRDCTTDMLLLPTKIIKFYRSHWNNWRAILKRNYLGNPWSIIALVAAFVVLLLTFTQTFYTVYQYYYPRVK